MKYLLILATLFLTACATEYVGWTYPMPPSKTTQWHHVSTPAMYHFCGYSREEKPHMQACAIQILQTQHCDIFSHMSEIDAKMTGLRGYSINLWAHEMEHCKGGRHAY